jgi:hypothetical protein
LTGPRPGASTDLHMLVWWRTRTDSVLAGPHFGADDGTLSGLHPKPWTHRERSLYARNAHCFSCLRELEPGYSTVSENDLRGLRSRACSAEMLRMGTRTRRYRSQRWTGSCTRRYASQNAHRQKITHQAFDRDLRQELDATIHLRQMAAKISYDGCWNHLSCKTSCCLGRDRHFGDLRILERDDLPPALFL